MNKYRSIDLKHTSTLTENILAEKENDPEVPEKALRLQQIRNLFGYDVAKMAQRLDMDDSNYRKLESGKRPIGKRLSEAIVKSFDLSPVWFETGQGEVLQPTGTVELGLVDEDLYEGVWLPYYPIRFQASFGEMSDPEQNYGQAERIKVIIRRGESADRNVVFEVDGDSMYPKYSRGTKIRCKLVNPGDWEYISSGVYAISYGNSTVIKRIKDNELLSKGYLTLHSDNPNYGGSNRVPADQLHHIWKVLRIVDSPAD